MGPAPYARDKPLSPLHEYPCGRVLFPELRISWVKGKSNSPTEKDFEGRKQKAGKKRDRRVEKKRKKKKILRKWDPPPSAQKLSLCLLLQIS